MACWTRDLCIWHYTEWQHVGLVISVSDIIQNGAMLDSWSVYLTLYRMTQCWTRDLCIWHYTEWCWTCDLCIWHYTEWIHVGLVICVSDIIQNGSMLDLWSVNLTLYRMMLDSGSGYLTLYRMMPCWTRHPCIWHYREWQHVGLVICVSDIQNDGTFDSWSVYLILYRMMLDLWSVYLILYRMTQCWTRNLCIWHYTE